MNRKWMSKDRRQGEYEKGMEEFIDFAVKYAKDPDRIICPCLECCFQTRVTLKELRDHLTIYGIDKDYTNWVRHVEVGNISGGDWGSRTNDEMEEMNNSEDDCLEDLIHVLEEDLRDCPEMFNSMSNDAKMPLYASCTKYSRLSAILKMYNLKASSGWSDESFTKMLTLVKDMLPENNTLPSSTYEAKKMMCSMGMSYEKTHACRNDCILYRNEYESLKSCPECNVSRYKKKEGVPAKVLWYFPIVPRFRRLFSNPEDAKKVTWHADPNGRIRDGKLRHPADAPQWIKIDREFPEFGGESRNLCLALATDGMNPHGGQSSSYSVWPVILVIYNLPPSLCMKRKYMMLSMLISGPKQPGNDIDVYLAPLIEDLKMMWETGVEVFDAYQNEKFIRALLIFRNQNQVGGSKKFKKKTKWDHIQCPQQTNGTDCGYFVLKFMRDIIDHKLTKIPELFLPKNGWPTYSQSEIDDIRIELAHYVLHFGR